MSLIRAIEITIMMMMNAAAMALAQMTKRIMAIVQSFVQEVRRCKIIICWYKRNGLVLDRTIVHKRFIKFSIETRYGGVWLSLSLFGVVDYMTIEFGFNCEFIRVVEVTAAARASKFFNNRKYVCDGFLSDVDCGRCERDAARGE